MPLEPAFDNIDDLVPTNPGVDDPVAQGDDHLRGIKSALKGNVTGDANVTRLLVAGSPMFNARANGADLFGTTEPDLADNDNALNIGTLAAAHVGIGPASLQGKASATTPATFTLNPYGGNIDFGSGLAAVGVRINAPLGQNAGLTLRENNITQFNLYHDAGLSAVRALMANSGDTFRIEETGKIAALFQPNSAQALYTNGVKVAETTTSGLKAAAVGQNTALEAITSTSVNEARLIAANARGGVIVLADGTGDYVRIGQASAAGVYEKFWARLDRDGGVSIYHNGTENLAVRSDGISVGNSVASNIRFNRNSHNYLDLAAGSAATLRVRNSAGLDTFYIDADNFTRLYFNTVRALDTADPDVYSTSIRIVHEDGSTYPGGLNVMPAMSIAADTTIGIEHQGKMINMNSSVTRVFTVPSSITNGFTTTLMVTSATGVARFTPASGVTLTWQDGAGGATGQRDVAAGGVITLFQRTADTWFIWGTGIS